MNPSRRTIGDSIVRQSWRSTHVKYLEALDVLARARTMHLELRDRPSRA
jgi:hypothetical protein